MFNCTDMGNAERFVARHGDKVRYAREWGWLYYDGLRWSKVDQSRIVELAKETVRAMQKEAIDLEDAGEKRQLGTWAFQSESGYHLEAMVKLSKGALYAEAKDFDGDPWLLNVKDGTIDLRTGGLRPHDPGDRITKLAPVDYKDPVPGTRWERFLLEVFDGNAELVDYVQRVIGYSLTGLSTEDVFFIAYGGGRNGKTTLFNTIQDALGDYASTASTNMILSQGTGIKQTYDLANLVGTRFVTMSETESGKKLDVTMVKDLTGGGVVSARSLYEKPITFKPQFTMFLSTNNKPEIGEMSDAIWERLKTIPFTVHFRNAAEAAVDHGNTDPIADKMLEDKLRVELPAILRWAVQGAIKWQRDGLKEPESVTEAIKEYHDEQNDLGDFIQERCVEGATESIKASELYRAYTDWLDPDVRLDAMSSTAFGAEMKRRYRSKRARGGVTYVGIGLKKDPSERLLRQALKNRVPDDEDED